MTDRHSDSAVDLGHTGESASTAWAARFVRRVEDVASDPLRATAHGGGVTASEAAAAATGRWLGGASSDAMVVGSDAGPWSAAAATGALPAVRVSATVLPFPVVVASVSFGGAVELVSGTGSDSVARNVVTALSGDGGAARWEVEVDGTRVDPAPWGIVATRTIHAGVSADGRFPDGRLTAALIEPASGGGLLGLLGGAAAVLGHADLRGAARVYVRGAGPVLVDGLRIDAPGATAWVIEAGPTVPLLQADPG